MKNHSRAFTLIEAVIYLALFGILIGGAVVAAYNMFESVGRGQTRAMMQEESEYLSGKIRWALSGAQAVTQPTASPLGTIGTLLTVVKWDTSVGNPITLFLSGTDLRLSTSSNPYDVILNNSNVRISNVQFLHMQASGDGINPETIAYSFTITVLTPNGMTLREDIATTTIALRR
jgi:type II secretory pathway pseudopilin PulG